MDPETLVTFAFRAPHDVRTVELLGSWDNFSHPYSMYHDRRRGQGFYTGCFQFNNIIFDGSEIDYTRPRSGGLKQGGTYWYYFRLDDGMEAYDDRRDCTADCPLMPGQVVNVIHVPTEVTEPLVRERSASVDLVGTLAQQSSFQTMNPKAKYQALDPPPVSKVHDRCVSDFAVNGRLERPPPTPREESYSPPSPVEKYPGRKMFSAVGSLQRRGLSLTGSLRSMASRAAVRARARQEARTYEANLIDEEAECASIRPPCSPRNDTSRPPTRRPRADSSANHSESQFQSFSQVIAIPTPSASPTKRSPDDSDTASIGPQSIRNIQFLGSSPEEHQARPRLYSLRNPDDDPTLLSSDHPPLPQTEQQSPALALASPTFSDATISTTEAGDITTPSAPYIDTSDDELAAKPQWGGPQLQTHDQYKLPEDSDLATKAHLCLPEGQARDTAKHILSEMGYLGDSIQ